MLEADELANNFDKPEDVEGCRVWQPTLDLGILRDRIKLSLLHGSRNQ
jgi:hypothetical protein